MPDLQHGVQHTVDPVYAPPVLRAPSPSDSLSTIYGRDETDEHEQILPDDIFARMVEENIGLRKTEWAQNASLLPIQVLLPKPRNIEEESVLYEQVMINLRKQVQAVKDEELFEAVVLRNLNPVFEQQPSSHDIDVIMRGLMGTSIAAKDSERRNSPVPKTNGDQSAGAGVTRHQHMNARSRF